MAETFEITPKDVGRVAFTSDGAGWLLVHFAGDKSTAPCVFRADCFDGVSATFRINGQAGWPSDEDALVSWDDPTQEDAPNA